jgi:hypothetical protein
MSKILKDRVLESLLESVSASLNEEAARKLVSIKANRRVRARVAQLARRCNEGKLTREERTEYETYVMAGEVVALFQAKARLLLKQREQPA